MPNAVVNLEDTERFDLKSLPEGYVVLRRLSYGEKLKRRAMTTHMTMKTQKGKKDLEAQMQLINEAASQFDFAHCVVEHNLEDANGSLLNLGSVADLQRLNPRVGDEIEQLMDQMNNFEENDSGN
jgi:hypothetical protein